MRCVRFRRPGGLSESRSFASLPHERYAFSTANSSQLWTLFLEVSRAFGPLALPATGSQRNESPYGYLWRQRLRWVRGVKELWGHWEGVVDTLMGI
jgi:hypothetical protein